MIKPIIRYFAKKYVAAMVSDLLEAASKKTDLELWKSRVKKVIQLCQRLSDALDDNKLTAEETDDIIDSATGLIS